jgi:hypothetical protein
VHRVLKQYKEREQTKSLPRSGRPPKFDERGKRHLVRIVEKDHSASLSQITAQIQNAIQKTVSTATVRHALHTQGYFGRVGIRKPFVSNANRLKRYKWCRERSTWDDEWNNIVWSDESRFELFGTKRRKWVWRRPKQALDKDCLVPTFKSGQKSVMIWGCFTRYGVGPLVRVEGRMAAADYIKVLETHLLPYLGSLGEAAFTFQEDNAAIHTAKKAKEWKQGKSIPCLPWPPQSPDLNPIEHLWDELERRVRGRSTLPKNEGELFGFLLEEWYKIPTRTLENLVDSLPRRVEAVCKAKGYPTRY